MSERMIADDEVLYRRIPPGKDWFEPPNRISTFNFKLRKDECGLSVYRALAISASDVLKKPDAIPGSKVAYATAGQVRLAKDSKGNALHLDVVPVNDENDPGHAEIRGQALREKARIAAKALRDSFVLIEAFAE